MHYREPRSTGIPPGAPAGGPRPSLADLDETARRLLLGNIVLLALGLVASTLLPGIARTPVGGDFTVGLLWGFAQITLFTTTAWRCARRLAHPTDAMTGADIAAVRATDNARDDGGRQWDR
ncbi:hypothetical protein [Streptomyces sp. NPDC097619]|uniref:hypothetical protein n=1 Tax=Streptomyces sp. NPDC097619 TaxID=3157228 RepID=UPI00332CE685